MESNLLDSLDLQVIPGADLLPKAKPAPAPKAKVKPERKVMVKRVHAPVVSNTQPQTMAGEGGNSAGEDRPAKIAKAEPKAIARVKGQAREKNPAKGQSKRGNQAREKDGESDIEGGKDGEWEHPHLAREFPNKKTKPGPAPRPWTKEGWERVLSGARLGMSFDKLWALSGMGEHGYKRHLSAHPHLIEEIKEARDSGEHSLLVRVSECEHGWQGSAWLLERARGYVARASLEHTGKGGSQLSIAHEVVGMLGGKEVG